jgi:hypothetical protein
MELFHNEIISFCLRKATIKLALIHICGKTGYYITGTIKISNKSINKL